MTDNKLFSQNVTDFLKALGNEKRQEILLTIFADEGEHNITEVSERAKIAQSTASEHLSQLKRAGILVSKKVEKEVFYTLNRPGIISILDEIRSLLNCCLEK
jgi:DNA-binding transcriptional ArsR family regulator